jgi:hypothetical protein
LARGLRTVQRCMVLTDSKPVCVVIELFEFSA